VTFKTGYKFPSNLEGSWSN